MPEKYREEIEEILKHAEEAMPKERATSAGKRPNTSSGRSSNLLSRFSSGGGLKISAGKLMLASFALLLLALILGASGLASPVILVVAGLVLFVIAYALLFVRPTSTAGYEKRWRGRLIEDNLSLWERFKRWLRG
ncbi:MAG: hypothetical protein J4F46_07110 [Dehalococcoidia bacterium]|nr:hypothetical protein [Dehalococcoidia bacterium]